MRLFPNYSSSKSHIMDEFALIKYYFNWGSDKNNVVIGVGDDAAIIDVPNGYQLVSSVDTSIAGVHFSNNAKPCDIAYKALAVNLSDLAAMGAVPKWFSLALTLPKLDKSWLAEFSKSLKILSNEFNLSLIGGDTAKGQLSISIHILGILPKTQRLLRSNAQIGDGIFVSNTLGDAALAWQLLQNNKLVPQNLLNKLHRPMPQVKLGLYLLDKANACIDISDGLLADLGHILNQSGVGAEIELAKIPLSNAVRNYVKKTNNWCLPLAGGDDYQLCCTIPKNKIKTNSLAKYQISQIGIITQKLGLNIMGGDIRNCQSYHHF